MLACLANAPRSAEAQAQSERPVREHNRLSIGLLLAWVIPPPTAGEQPETKDRYFGAACGCKATNTVRSCA